MWWIIVIAIIGGLIVLGIFLLSIPFDLKLRFEFYQKPRFDLSWSWFFSLLSGEIKPRKRKSEKPRALRKFPVSRTIWSVRKISDMWRIKGLAIQLVRLIKDISHSFSIKELEIEFNIGLDDPFETLYLFAVAEPVNQILYLCQPYTVNIRTSFLGPVFEGYANSCLRIYPLRLTMPLVKFIFSPPGFRLITKMVAIRWRRNR